MRAIGRGVVLAVLAGCVAMYPTRGGAEALDEQPIAVPEQETVTQPATVPAAGEALTVRDVRIESTETGRRLVVALSRPVDGISDFTLNTPPRVVVDVHGPAAGARVREQRFAVNDPAVSRVRVAPRDGQLRVVLDLKKRGAIQTVRQDGETLVADLAGGAVPTTATKRAPEAKRVAAPAIEEPPPYLVQPDAHEAIAPVEDGYRRVEAQPARLAAARVARDTLAPLSQEPVYRGQKISLDFKDADIQNVLRVLADVSGLNIIATDDVQGKVTLHLTDVPWDQAFDLVLRTNRLEKTHDGNVVRVSSVNRLKEERDALKAAEQSEKELEALRVKYIRVNYARADEALVDKVKGVLTERGAATFDERTNTIIVRDIARGIDDASHLIRELDVQSPQVLIEANIVEATQDFSRGLGVQWGYRYNGGPQTNTPTGMNFPGTVGVGGSGLGLGNGAPSPTGNLPRPVPFLADFPVPAGFGSGFGPGAGSALDLALGSLDGAHQLNVRLTALENEGKGKVISRPRVITMNNVAATIQSLTIIRVKLPSNGSIISTGGGGATTGGNATEKINTGITLVVTPQVSSDGYVLMNIFAKSSLPDFTRSVDGIPSEISREANSNVLIRNGDTVVLGGIYRHTGDDREDGLPYLRDVPGLGWLFKRSLTTKRHEELLVFLTPKIVEAGSASLPPAERLWTERRGG
jgi:type IV pilus assembly protein PilQ